MSSLVPMTWKDSLEGLRDRVLRVFDRWQPRRTRPNGGNGDYWPVSVLDLGGPAVDLAETDDEVLVTAELPGLDEKDFKVEVEERRLVLRGEKKAEREERRDGRYYSERSYGGFYRAVPLPCEIEPDKANARYRHGVLRVRLPKSDAAKARRKRITVN